MDVDGVIPASPFVWNPEGRMAVAWRVIPNGEKTLFLLRFRRFALRRRRASGGCGMSLRRRTGNRSWPRRRCRSGSGGCRPGGNWSGTGGRRGTDGNRCVRMVRRCRTLLSRRAVGRGWRRIVRRSTRAGRVCRARRRCGCVCMGRGGHRPCRGHGCRRTMISRRQLTSVGACGVLMGNLVGRRLYVLFPPGRGLLSCWPRGNAARAVEAGSGCVVIHYRRVISVVNHRSVHLRNGRIIRVMAGLPSATEETNSAVAETVINPAVESNMRSPVTSMEAVKSSGKAPIRRCPQDADAGWRHPDARYPIIARVTVSPVARVPEISICGTRWLYVYRERRRGKRNGEENSGRRYCRGRQNRNSHQQIWYEVKLSHVAPSFGISRLNPVPARFGSRNGY
jgi:hypothetical protein